MKIQNTNINFGQKYPTGKVLEITSRKIFESDGFFGLVETLKQVHKNIPKYTGHQGYRRYAEEVGNKIIAKYPDIAQATKDIIEIADKHPYCYTKDLRKMVEPILNRFEKEIDIVV